MNWEEDYKRKLTTADEAVKHFCSNDVILIQGGTGIPPAIANALTRRASELQNVTICQGFALFLPEYMKPEYKNNFHVETVFIGPAERAAMKWGTADFVPHHLGHVGKWFDDRGINKVATVVTPPDENGFMNRSSFAGLCTKRTVDNAEAVVVEINKFAPWLCSDVFQIHVSQCAAIVENHVPLVEIPEIPVTPVEEQIAHIIADMVPHAATIQLGLGGLANCVGHFLKDKRDLGVHTEVASNCLMELIKCGAINGSKKTFQPGKVVYTFCVGTRELWDFMDHNELFVGMEIDQVNNPNVIARNDNLVSVNNALMIDLTGQVASESIGTFQYSATGGQAHFVQGAQMSKGGKSILALPSTRKDKEGIIHSRILPTFSEGTVVSTSRNDVEWVVTEYGAVKLTHKPISWRVKQLIAIAHPDFRDELSFKAKSIGWI